MNGLAMLILSGPEVNHIKMAMIDTDLTIKWTPVVTLSDPTTEANWLTVIEDSEGFKSIRITQWSLRGLLEYTEKLTKMGYKDVFNHTEESFLAGLPDNRPKKATPKKRVRISFTASGQVHQSVELEPDMTPELLQKLLRSGDAATTINENGDVTVGIMGIVGLRVVGKVIDVDNDLEYTDFLVSEDNI